MEIENVKIFYADFSGNSPLEDAQKESSEYIKLLKAKGLKYECHVHTSAAQYAWYYTLTVILL